MNPSAVSTTEPAPAGTAAEGWADHLMPLPGGSWLMWRPAVLRAAGFPASLVLATAGERAPAAADAFLHARARVIACRKTTLSQLGDALRVAPPDARTRLRAVRRRIRAGKVAPGTSSPWEDVVRSALDARELAHAALSAAYDADTEGATASLTRLLSDDRFREAVLWQNQSALAHVDRMPHDEGDARAKRPACTWLAMLLQRYTVKNDSIGFFGPVGWATLVDEPFVIRFTPGRELLARREVYFEGWAIDALVQRLAADPAMKPWTAPRLAPGVWRSAEAIYAPLIGAVPISERDRQVLELCDGARSAREVADSLLATPRTLFASEADVFATLQSLVERKLLAWRLDVSPQLHPERDLMAQLERIGDIELRRQCEAKLAVLVGARDRVAAAGGCPSLLSERLDSMNDTFTRLTGADPTRRHGQMYAGRGLVYEDCRRADQVALGSEFAAKVGPALSIVLDSARWLAGEVAARFRSSLRQRFAEAIDRYGAAAVDGHRFYLHVSERIEDERARIRAQVEPLFRRKWQSVLLAGGEERHVVRSVGEVVARGREAFATCEPAWSRARYMSPDIMIAAPDLEALRAGSFECVLGEVHCGNSLVWSGLAAQHPHPQRLVDAVTHDAQDLMVFTQVPRDQWLARLNVAARPASAWRYEFLEDLPSQPGCRPLPAALLVPFEAGGTIRMRARDGSLELDAIELFGAPLGWEVDCLLKQFLPDAPRLPRVTIGALTIARERWYAGRGDMPFLATRDCAALFAELRGWARARGMPRRVFYKSPRERKPCYLDFDSPIYVKLFLKMLARLDESMVVRIDEMLPRFEDTWVVDRNGRSYTSEFRFTALPVSAETS